MATGLSNQAAAATDPGFLQLVTDAIVAQAISIYSEATTLAANVNSVATTSVSITPGLSSGLASGTVVVVGGDWFVTLSGAAAIGAATLAITSSTPTRTHLQGESVSPPTPANHGTRASYAKNLLNGPQSGTPLCPPGYAFVFAWALASQGLDKNSTDAAILNGVASIWNALAGA